MDSSINDGQRARNGFCKPMTVANRGCGLVSIDGIECTPSQERRITRWEHEATLEFRACPSK